MIETVTRKRIEILVDAPLLDHVTRAIDAAGITGWSVSPVVAGKGRDGRWREDRVTGAADKSFVLTVASPDKAMALAEALAPVLTSYGLLLTMWDVEVIRGERF